MAPDFVPRAILFDLDNTLIDFMRMKRASCEAAISAMVDAGLQIEKDAAYKELFSLYDVHGIEDQRIFQKFLGKVAGGIDYKILASGITAYRRAQTGVLEPYPHVRSTLLRLKERGIKLGIVSDAPRLRAWIRLSEMNLADFFDVVVTLGDTKRRKPSRLPFDAALKQMGMAADEILFVGDNPERDIAGAKRAGMKAALAKYGQTFDVKGPEPDYILKDIADLLEIVRAPAAK
ncbi:MAG: HAD-IIIA family hydrolase [Candidatus Diapherotrites archaeon]|nr:HAD-IIIA family hydrolase [Candidatus Micrarchaeota archaeon]MBU1939257.1 HAD-IIIA family hydrolase [Candidatus Micrarchaeota archaeon]